MSIHKLKVAANGDVGTGFSTNWNDRIVIATCDHLFVGLGHGSPLSTLMEIDGQAHEVEVRRHSLADVAIVMVELARPLRRLQAVADVAPASSLIEVCGYPVNASQVSISGFTRGVHPHTSTFHHPGGNKRTYAGTLIPASIPGSPGLSGSPMLLDPVGVVAIYSTWTGSTAVTGGFHVGHVSEIGY